MAVKGNEIVEVPTESLTMAQLRGILSETVMLLRTEEKPPASANAISNAIGKFLSTIRLEMDYQRLSGRKAIIPLLDAGIEPVDGNKA
jgi:hypothetical protein